MPRTIVAEQLLHDLRAHTKRRCEQSPERRTQIDPFPRLADFQPCRSGLDPGAHQAGRAGARKLIPGRRRDQDGIEKRRQEIDRSIRSRSFWGDVSLTASSDQ